MPELVLAGSSALFGGLVLTREQRGAMAPLHLERLLRLRDHVTAHPDRYNQSVWADWDEIEGPGVNACGTTACLAGWAVLLEPGWSIVSVNVEADDDEEDTEVAVYAIPPVVGLPVQIPDAAGMLLGLTRMEQINLFHMPAEIALATLDGLIDKARLDG